MKYISIILLIISLIISLIIFYYINANIIEKFYMLDKNEFKFPGTFYNIKNKGIENKKRCNDIKKIIENTLEPQLKIINDTIEKYNSFEDTINGYGFL
jgi:hypothetical protein